MRACQTLWEKEMEELPIPGADIHGATERLLGLVNPAGYHLLLLVHVGSNHAVARQLRTIKRDYVSLGATLKGSGAQVVSPLSSQSEEGV